MMRRRLVVVAFFVAVLLAQLLLEPAYAGYVAAFAGLAIVHVLQRGLSFPSRIPLSRAWLILAPLLAVVLVITVRNGPAARDVVRDVGAIAAFLIGRRLLIAVLGRDGEVELLRAISTLGVIVSLATLMGAGLAFRAGASAYEWRGEYVPLAHSWLPYAFVANFVLASLGPDEARRHVRRLVLCVVATIASLSRTDLVLGLLFAAVLLAGNWRFVLLRLRALRWLVVAIGVFAVLAPLALQLEVVQERIEFGVGEADPSNTWRFIENASVLEHFAQAGPAEALFGFGFGARVPLPLGITDFSDNDSLPHLHNSFLTMALKFGIVGLLVVTAYAARILVRSLAAADPRARTLRFAGRWIVLFCLAKAVTLQGLSEWSHLVFFGVGCMLAQAAAHETNDVVESSATPVTGSGTMEPLSTPGAAT